MNNLNEKLKQLRMDGKFTQQQIADHLFVSRQAVSNWENGKNIPDLSTIILLSKFYGVSLDTLLKGEKEVIKSMKKELDSINASDLTGIVLMIILSFVLPVFGLVIAVCFEKIKGSCLPEVGKGAGSAGNRISNLLNPLCGLSNILFLVHDYGDDRQPRNTVKTLISQRVKHRLLYSAHTFWDKKSI
mgnify:CR=1 FL=1